MKNALLKQVENILQFNKFDHLKTNICSYDQIESWNYCAILLSSGNYQYV